MIKCTNKYFTTLKDIYVLNQKIQFANFILFFFSVLLYITIIIPNNMIGVLPTSYVMKNEV